MSDDWNLILVNQAISTLWLKNLDSQRIKRQQSATIDAMAGIKPQSQGARSQDGAGRLCPHRSQLLDEFYRVAFRKKIYRTIDELRSRCWVTIYNETRPHQERWCYGKTRMQTFLDALPIAREKLLPAA